MNLELPKLKVIDGASSAAHPQVSPRMQNLVLLLHSKSGTALLSYLTTVSYMFVGNVMLSPKMLK